MGFAVRYLALLAVLSGPATVLADKPVPIEKVLTAPDSFQLNTVRLQGQVRELQRLEPYWAFNRQCYAVRFNLADPTGSMEVLVPGLCGNPTLDPAPVFPFENGDRVVIEARIQAPGHAIGGHGLPPGSGTKPATQAIAINVNPVSN